MATKPALQEESFLGPGSGLLEVTVPSTCRGILFVGGSPDWFDQMQVGINELMPECSCSHEPDRPQALQALLGGAFDVVFFHEWTSEDGKVLEAAANRSPNLLRFLRCGAGDRETTARCQQFNLAQIKDDDDVPAMVGAIKRAFRLRTWMADRAIRQLLPLMRKLPVAPDLYNQISDLLRCPDSPLDDVAQLIAQEPVMSAKMLQLVNSTFFGLGCEVSDPAQAVLLLGTERTRSLVLLAGMFSQFDYIQCQGFPEPVFAHCLVVGSMAGTIALAETEDPKTAEEAFTAGLLHDVGKLILAGNLPDTYTTIRKLQKKKTEPPLQTELKMLGTTHAELGACLLGTWGLPLSTLEAIAWHHAPERSEDTGFSLLTAVHAANIMSHEAGVGSGAQGVEETMSLPYLQRLGVAHRRNPWRELCGLPAKPEED